MEEMVLQLLQDLRPDIEFQTEDNLITNGLLESLDLIQLIALLEEKFGITIDNQFITVENFDSLDRISRLVEKLQK